MRSDGHDSSRFVPRAPMPAIDHEANGPISALVQLTAWLGRRWGAHADRARGQLILQGRRWL
jgi:hypothetical protein